MPKYFMHYWGPLFAVLTLIGLLGGCAIPSVTVNKNIYIYDSSDLVVEYDTKSELETAAEIVQDIKPDIKVPVPVP